MEEVIEGVMYPLPALSRPSEEGGSDEASRATLLTRLSISPALSSVLSFSSWISLGDRSTSYFYFKLKLSYKTTIKKPLNQMKGKVDSLNLLVNGLQLFL